MRSVHPEHHVLRPSLVVALLAVLPSAACALQAGPSPLDVPAEPPDSIPQGIFDNVDPEYGVPPDVLTVTFIPGLTRDQKAGLLAAVGAEAIIGGAPFPVLDGIYLVRIRTGGDIQVLLRAIARLNAREEVVSAALLTQLTPS